MSILNNDISPSLIQQVWEKGIEVAGYDPDMYRKNYADAWISRDHYGDTDSIMGWEIDHLYPESLGGDCKLINLRPMNWNNNRSKGNDYPDYRAVLTSEGDKNIFKDVSCTIGSAIQQQLDKLYKK